MKPGFGFVPGSVVLENQYLSTTVEQLDNNTVEQHCRTTGQQHCTTTLYNNTVPYTVFVNTVNNVMI